jgi:RHS repeat-associated protein
MITDGWPLGALSLEAYGGHVRWDHIGLAPGPAPARISDAVVPASPRPAGKPLTWSISALGGTPPIQYRFRRQDGAAWTTVQPYGATNSYTWTPSAEDAGTHAIRVSVRNAGSTADAEDSRSYVIAIGPEGSAAVPADAIRPTAANSSSDMRPAALSTNAPSVATNSSSGDLRRYSFYTPELNLLSETVLTADATPIPAYDYAWLGGQPVAQIDMVTTTIHWTFTDHLGTPAAQTNTSGTIDWRVEREPYGGRTLMRAGTNRHQPLAFPGQEEPDSNREPSYNIFRWYRPSFTRYTQADPLMAGQPFLHRSDKNLYRYANDNPLYFVDVRGLKTSCPRPPTTGACAADCIALYRWAHCLFHEVHNATLAMETIKTLGTSAAEHFCKGHGGEAELGEGIGTAAYTSVTSSKLADKLFDQSVLNCVRLCSSSERCGALKDRDFFNGCGARREDETPPVPHAFR